MANDCLVKRLKGTVNNDNLPYFNAISVNFRAGYTQNNRVIAIYTTIAGPLEIKCSKTISIYGDGADPLYTGNNYETTTPSGIGAYFILFPDDNGVCHIIGKNLVTSIGLNYNHPTLGTATNKMSYYLDLENLKYWSCKELLTSIYSSHGTICGTHYSPETCLEYSIQGDDADKTNLIDGTIDSFANCVSLRKFVLRGCVNVTGNLNTLSDLTQLTELWLWGTNTAGDLKTLCEDMVANGRTSGTLHLFCVAEGSENRTWDGNQLTRAYCKQLNNGGGDFDLYVLFSSSYPDGFQIDPR